MLLFVTRNKTKGCPNLSILDDDNEMQPIGMANVPRIMPQTMIGVFKNPTNDNRDKTKNKISSIRKTRFK